MRFVGVEVEQETSAPPPKRNPGSAPVEPLDKKPLFKELRWVLRNSLWFSESRATKKKSQTNDFSQFSQILLSPQLALV